MQASKAPPSSSASLAATKAFIRDRESNGALSSAAAAAALRTHTPTPTPVGETVTKRMMRKNSHSSQGSGSQRPNNLRRHSSSGSMTERSFRAPSPSRSSPIDPDAPPVPAVPKEVPGVGVVHRRASSLEPPYRGGSPAGRGGGRGVSLDRGVEATPGRGQPRVSHLSKVSEDEQNAGVRSSVNFSRPISPQQAPSPRTNRGQQKGWFGGPVVNPEQTFRGAKPRPKTADGLSTFETHGIQQNVQNAADRPVSTKRSQLAHGVEGSRLASGSMHARPSGTAVQSRPQHAAPPAHQGPPRTVDPKSPYAVYDPSTRTFIHKGDAIALHKAMSEEDIHSGQHKLHQESGQRHYEASQQARVQQQPTQPQHVDQWVSSAPQKQPRNDLNDQHEHVAPARRIQPSFSEEREPEPQTEELHKGTVMERQHSEDFAGADIRPVDANTSRKLESNDLEATADPQSPKLASNLEGPYPRLKPPTRHTAKPSPSPERSNSRADRNPSLSPPRNAHFAPVAVEMEGAKHQPLPRSVSPGKSAMKLSPSPSRRSYSPVANDGRMVSRGAASETSDTVSDEGTRKKKKNVRVSFDEAPVIAGTSAYADSEAPHVPTGLNASRWSSAGEDDMDDYMKPRPVLPSFGSIRDKDRRSRGEEAPEKVTETVSSSLSASATSTSDLSEASNDHNIGGILAQDFATKDKDRQPSPQEPLPPEVTTVEGSGYASSSSDDSDAYEPVSQIPAESCRSDEASRSTPVPEPKTLTDPVETKPTASEVPAITVQPATPLAMEATELTSKPEPKVRRRSVPGGWDDEEESDIEPQENKTSVAPATTPASTSLSIRFEVPPPRDVDTDSTDNDSIYSDAYEELTDSEEAFGSINAILESPAAKPTGLMASKHATISPDAQAPGFQGEAKTRPKAQSSDSWDEAQQHWSEMNNLREQRQQPAQQAAPVSTPVAASKKESPSKAVKSQQRNIRGDSVDEPVKKPTSKTAQSTAQPRKSAMKKPTNPPHATSTSEPHLRKSMRDGPTPTNAPASEPHFRKSMRDGPVAGSASTDTQMKRTMRGSDSPGTNRSTSGLAASRYSMPPLDTKPPKGTLQKRHIPATAAASSASRPRPQSASAGAPPKSMTPAPTYDSDSDASASSFQRSRPRRARKEGGRYTMRGSMRSGPSPTMRPAPTMRPTSPPTTTSPPPTMRRSMRPSSPTVESPATAGVRPSKFSIRSLSPAGRFRPKSSMDNAPPLPTQTSSQKKMMPVFNKKSKTPTAQAPKSRFKSRFADSSDEDDDVPRRFQSRFADSDDDDIELPPDLKPVRGIPRRAGDEDGDSTDLEDEESDVEVASPTAKDIEKGKLAPTNGVTNGKGPDLLSESLRDSKHAPATLPAMEAGKKAKTKRGFFGLGKKKAPASYITEPNADARNGASTDIPMPPEHRNRDVNRPLTPIGEDKDMEAGQPASRSPKLQRRSNTPQWGRSTSDSWPLPQPTAIVAEQRPFSADGITKRSSSFRPTLKKRQSSQASGAPTASNPNHGKEAVAGKKKKFQGLRRVFGLND
ncbi:hypothetical protein CC80DRAFT_210268 [Byssothecium circinans]|uniref:Uncharacterized protein n=1 Tax=Byssothecium circinans TaxID=147558 RepID=A0A6A5TR12_9PLEO|nr:hypothetical protein CC80DRAFT_210268 [Byssothecium circinans]